MKHDKTIIESQLDCRASASLQTQIAHDLSQPDKSIKELLDKDTEADEVQSNQPSGN